MGVENAGTASTPGVIINGCGDSGSQCVAVLWTYSTGIKDLWNTCMAFDLLLLSSP